MGGPQVRTPRGELARLREAQRGRKSAVAKRIMEAMLETCGEMGYRNVSRSGPDRSVWRQPSRVLRPLPQQG
jgi:hypothetical protein